MNIPFARRRVDVEELAQRIYGGYLQGAFPMDSGRGIELYTADPRALLPIDEFRVPRSVRRALHRHSDMEVRINGAFSEVVAACANRGHGDWLTPELADVYDILHGAHLAHSVEVWQQGELVGGLFGVQMGAAFSADSMFHRAPDAGNIALVACAHRLRERGFHLWDIQMASDHTQRFGLESVSLEDYLARLMVARQMPRHFGAFPRQETEQE